MTIRVCICDDDPVFLDILSTYINKEADLKVVGVSGTKAELMELLRTETIDVLLLDMNLSGDYQGGLNAALESQWLGIELKIIILSSFDSEEIVLQAMTFGRVVNYITKEYYSDIPLAIRQAHAKQSGIHHSSAQRLVNRLIISEEQQLKSQFSKLQVQILHLLSEGYDRREIANELFYTEQSINNEIFKVSKLLKGKFPYLEWLRLKKQNTSEMVDLAKKLNIIP